MPRTQVIDFPPIHRKFEQFGSAKSLHHQAPIPVSAGECLVKSESDNRFVSRFTGCIPAFFQKPLGSFGVSLK
ncbi:MAG: hypothetical protein ACKOS8_03415, partial [Gemmataceae bacterium]